MYIYYYTWILLNSSEPFIILVFVSPSILRFEIKISILNQNHKCIVNIVLVYINSFCELEISILLNNVI